MLLIVLLYVWQAADSKRHLDEQNAMVEELEMSKKKYGKELESMQALVAELQNNNGKLEKSKKRLQEEVGISVRGEFSMDFRGRQIGIYDRVFIPGRAPHARQVEG